MASIHTHARLNTADGLSSCDKQSLSSGRLHSFSRRRAAHTLCKGCSPRHNGVLASKAPHRGILMESLQRSVLRQQTATAIVCSALSHSTHCSPGGLGLGLWFGLCAQLSAKAYIAPQVGAVVVTLLTTRSLHLHGRGRAHRCGLPASHDCLVVAGRGGRPIPAVRAQADARGAAWLHPAWSATATTAIPILHPVAGEAASGGTGIAVPRGRGAVPVLCKAATILGRDTLPHLAATVGRCRLAPGITAEAEVGCSILLPVVVVCSWRR